MGGEGWWIREKRTLLDFVHFRVRLSISIWMLSSARITERLTGCVEHVQIFQTRRPRHGGPAVDEQPPYRDLYYALVR